MVNAEASAYRAPAAGTVTFNTSVLPSTSVTTMDVLPTEYPVSVKLELPVGITAETDDGAMLVTA